jgi:hypothetical protein
VDVDRLIELGCTETHVRCLGAHFGYFAYRVMDYRESHGVEYRGQWFVRVFTEGRLPVKSVQPRLFLFDRPRPLGVS